MKREVIASENAPAAVGPYSQAIRIGNLIYTAGQVGIDPATGKLVEAENADDNITVQTEQVLKNLSAVLEAAGSGLQHVIKTTVFLRRIKDYAAMNAVYAQFFTEAPPARSAFAVAALPLGAQVEIEVVALVPEAAETAAEAESEEGDILTDAVNAVESAVATGLKELSQFFAHLKDQLEDEVDTTADEAEEEKPKKKKKDKKNKKKNKKKDKKDKKKK